VQAARAPLKEAFELAGGFSDVKLGDLRKLRQEDYLTALKVVRPSVSVQTVEEMRRWGERVTRD
jgi:hypothetical protein